jgi:plasmid stabilization system protein ParE
MSYVLGTEVEFDLNEIWEHIALDSVDVADKWIGKLFDAFELIGQNPQIGHRREDLTGFDVLFWPVGSFLVIYRQGTEAVEIVAVVRGARDIPSFLVKRS